MLCFGVSNDLLDNGVLQRFLCQRGSNENLSWHVCSSTDKAVVSYVTYSLCFLPLPALFIGTDKTKILRNVSNKG